MDPTKRTSEQALQDPYFQEDPLPTLEYVSSFLCTLLQVEGVRWWLKAREDLLLESLFPWLIPPRETLAERSCTLKQAKAVKRGMKTSLRMIISQFYRQKKLKLRTDGTFIIDRSARTVYTKPVGNWAFKNSVSLLRYYTSPFPHPYYTHDINCAWTHWY